jgi:hypothetical protein
MERGSGRELGKEDGKVSRKRKWEGKVGREGENRRRKKRRRGKRMIILLLNVVIVITPSKNLPMSLEKSVKDLKE